MKRLSLGLLLAASTMLVPVSASAEPERLMLGTGNIPIHPLNVRVIIPWAEKVTAESNGALELVVRHGQMLVNGENYVDRITDDVVQIAWGMMALQPGRFPRVLVSSVPFIEGSAEATAIAFCKLYEDGSFDADLAEFKPLFFVPFPQSSIHMHEGSLTSLADLAGKVVMVGSPTAAEVVTGLGGTPLSTPLYDHYQALQLGTANANIIPFTAFPAFNLQEVTSSHLVAPMGGAVGMVFMSRARWDALSPEARAVLEANSGCDVTRSVGAIVDQWEAEGRAMVEGLDGHTVTDIAPEELATLQADLAETVYDSFRGRFDGAPELLDQWKAAMTAARAELGQD
ncbi:MAG: TRAP transporter substrate-binding protein DctP [Tabrizicola sp.]|nr:TRAP transporter substrate-binding protein DctP [Tabrizicola sp.]